MVEKIAFVYSTLIQAGMVAGQIYQPTISLNLNERGGRHLLVVTAGMLFNNFGIYATELDILHNGKSVIVDSTQDGQAELPYRETKPDGQQIYIYSMYANSVDLDSSGLYRVVVRVFRASNGQRTGNPIDEKDCYFYVSYREDTADE